MVSRASLELVCRVSKVCRDSLASPAPLERRETSGDQAFLGSTAPLALQAFRESEVTSYGQIQLVVGTGSVYCVSAEHLSGPSKRLLNE